MRHTLSVLVEDKPGVLTRIAGLFGRRAFNIDSLTVAGTERPGYSRMTIVTRGDRHVMEQIEKQLYKQINVLKVSNLTSAPAVERELVLIKVQADAQSRAAVTQIVNIFRARIVDVAPRSLVVEVTGDRDKIDAILSMLRPFGIKEVVRSGPVAVSRGHGSLAVPEENGPSQYERDNLMAVADEAAAGVNVAGMK
jgi:acetolactate synthase I/III small subunit